MFCLIGNIFQYRLLYKWPIQLYTRNGEGFHITMDFS
ncbi:unnamed protein product, partial [Vitis vinifera]|uniref:Uncharacterized protein n=1 Tax=Vitis vinifera TaxID=29760 RepID=D7U3H0_VITVI